jgi:hypothetical protein
MLTPYCYQQIERQLGFRSMFSASLEYACNLHQSIIESIADDILEWAVPISQAIPVLTGLGYSSVQITDAIRLLSDTEEEFNSVEVEPYDDGEEAAE